VKHFALNSIENARFKVDVQIDERTLHEIYLPHFKRVLDAGCASVMSAYNKMNGEYCGQNRPLLTDILRGEWGFDGFVHSDWIKGVYQVYGAPAGLDIENPEPRVYGRHLVAATEAGQVEPHVIDTACTRILTILYTCLCAEDPLPDYPMTLVASEAHRALAREAAEKSAVLLENAGVLPLNRKKVKRLAVLGRLAGLVNTGDAGSSFVRAKHIVTALEGLQTYLGDGSILTGDETDLAAAAAAAASADAVVVVAGTTLEHEGEYITGGMTLGEDGKQTDKDRGGDRADLGLPADQVALIQAAAASGKPVIVVLVCGSAVLVEAWRGGVAAILQTFYSGMEGGHALARLLFGDVSPSGRLPFSVARDAAHYPFFDRFADEIEYGYWHGYAKLAAEGIEPRYPFGHGLTYSSVSYRALKVRRQAGAIEASVAVRNEGNFAVEEVVQFYAGFPGTVTPRAKKLLAAFEKVALAPSETRIVRVTIPLDTLRYRDPGTHSWRLERGEYVIEAARNSSAPSSTVASIRI
jgi:beta-glucosidase